MAIEGDTGPGRGKIGTAASHSTVLLPNEMIATQIYPFKPHTVLKVGATGSSIPPRLVTKNRIRGLGGGVHKNRVNLRIMAACTANHLMALQATALAASGSLTHILLRTTTTGDTDRITATEGTDHGQNGAAASQ